MVTFHTYEDLPEDEQVSFLKKQGMTENEYLKKRNANLKGVPIAQAKEEAVNTFSYLKDLSPEELKERDERFAKGEIFSANRDKHREKQMLHKKHCSYLSRILSLSTLGLIQTWIEQAWIDLARLRWPEIFNPIQSNIFKPQSNPIQLGLIRIGLNWIGLDCIECGVG